MKKLFMVLLAIVSLQINCNAQWKKMHVEGDDFAGVQSCTVYTYLCKEGGFSFYIRDDGYYGSPIITTENGIYDYSIFSNNNITSGKIGLFDENNNVVKSWSNRDFYIDGSGTTAMPTERMSSKILEYLIDEEGYVRILINKYKGGKLDIKIPCLDINNVEELVMSE